MRRHPTIRLVMLSGAGVLLAPLIQALPQQPEREFTLRSEVRLVLLDVSVRDRAGNYVAGLTKENFTVLEDGKPQRTTSFAGFDVPVTVGIVVDESLSMAPKRADVLNGALAFIGESNPKDEIFIVNFNDTVSLGLPPDIPFSDEIQQLGAALHRGKAQGKTALNDAIVTAIRHLELGRRGKKALVVISDGGDNASAASRAQMLDAVEASAATIYTVGLYTAQDPDQDPHLLKQIARISGGDAFFPETVSETIPLCRRIAREIRSRYTIGYVPPSGDSPLRRIQVRVSATGHEKLVAHTRTSYRYEENAAQTTR